MGDINPSEELLALFQEAHTATEARIATTESWMQVRVTQTESKLEAQLQ